MASSSRKSWHWWVNAIAFVSLVIIGIALLLSEVGLGTKLSSFLKEVAIAIAFVVVAACSFIYASGKMRRKNGLVYMIVWVIAVVLITIAYIIPMVN